MPMLCTLRTRAQQWRGAIATSVVAGNVICRHAKWGRAHSATNAITAAAAGGRERNGGSQMQLHRIGSTDFIWTCDGEISLLLLIIIIPIIIIVVLIGCICTIIGKGRSDDANGTSSRR